jgi:hypothetical protein
VGSGVDVSVGSGVASGRDVDVGRTGISVEIGGGVAGEEQEQRRTRRVTEDRSMRVVEVCDIMRF